MSTSILKFQPILRSSVLGLRPLALAQEEMSEFTEQLRASRTGVCIRSDAPLLKPGTYVEFEIKSPKENAVVRGQGLILSYSDEQGPNAGANIRIARFLRKPPPNVPLPEATAVAALFTKLTEHTFSAEESKLSVQKLYGASGTLAAAYLDDAQVPVALCCADVGFAQAIAGAFGLPAPSTSDAQLPAETRDCLNETFNVGVGLFNDPKKNPARHVKLEKMYVHPDALPPALAEILKWPASRLDLDLAVGTRRCTLSFLSV